MKVCEDVNGSVKVILCKASCDSGADASLDSRFALHFGCVFPELKRLLQWHITLALVPFLNLFSTAHKG